MYSLLNTMTNEQMSKMNIFLFQNPDCRLSERDHEIVESAPNHQTCVATVTIIGCSGYCESSLFWLPASLGSDPTQCSATGNGGIYGVTSNKDCSCTCCKPVELVTEIKLVLFLCSTQTAYQRNVALSMAKKCECVPW